MPFIEFDRGDQNDHCAKQRDARVGEALAFHANVIGLVYGETPDEPGQAETNENVKDIAADRIRYGHVALAVLGHKQTGQRVRNLNLCMIM